MEDNKLKCLYWNIHGISSKIIGQKNDHPEFLKNVSAYDVICISELHTNDIVSIPGFYRKKQKFRQKNHKGPKIGGGIAVYINQEIRDNFRLIPNSNVDSIWIRSKGPDETVLGFYYCSPDYGDSDFFETVQDEIDKFSNGTNTFIFGDFNARTKNECENIVHDRFDSDLGLDTTMRDLPLTRNSEDMKMKNKRGKEFLDICRANDLTIANGRVMGDVFGKYTCHQRLGSSVVDYLISPYKSMRNLLEFRVGDIQLLLSDHCPIMATIHLKNVLKRSQGEEVQMEDLPDKHIWNSESSETFTNALKSDICKQKVQTLLGKEDLKVVDIKNFLMDTASASKIRKAKRRKQRVDQPWFDKECQNTKRDIGASGKILRSNPHDTKAREKLYTLKRTLRNMVRKKKHEFKQCFIDNMCSELSSGPQKEYWRQLKKLEGRPNEQKYMSDFTLINHFKELLFDDKIDLQFQEQDNTTVGSLDYPIDLEELKTATKILKTGKGTGLDIIRNEMLVPLVDLYPELVLRAFNEILEEHGTLCKDWLHSLVSAIHKKGAKEDPDNYRGISLMSCLGKLFLTIINNRLMDFCISKGLISSSELGFVPGNRTSDPHIILHNLIQKYCHKRKKRLYGCFVDFSKAFDCVPRDILIKKLQDKGIDGKVLEIIKTLYLEDTASVKIGGKFSKPFKTNRGVRQGCVLSPLLFILFLSDLQEILDRSKDNVKLNTDTEISCIMWADDILILSETKEGLQRKLDALAEYSKRNKLTVNTKKTQCMIFNKTGRLLKNYKFTYDNKTLECVREYKYLGFIVTPSGEIGTGLKDLRNRAMRGLAKMRTSLGPYFRHNISNTIHLYTYIVRPILLYCCDFWGCIKQPKNNPIVTFHLSFCKQLLGVRRQTSNHAVLQEIGLLPISLHITKIAIRNWERITDKRANPLLLASHADAYAENLPWASEVREIFASNGMLETYLLKVEGSLEDTEPNYIEKTLMQRMTDQYNQTSFGTINSSRKLKTLRRLKSTPGRETYLREVEISKHRVAMSRLRLCSHSLESERGRYDETDAEKRHCQYCKAHGKEEVEDEAHFLVSCPQHNELRKSLLPQNILHNNSLSKEDKLAQILSESEHIKSVAEFIYLAFEDRKLSLEVLGSIDALIDSVDKYITHASDPQKNRYGILNSREDGMKITLLRISSCVIKNSSEDCMKFTLSRDFLKR